MTDPIHRRPRPLFGADSPPPPPSHAVVLVRLNFLVHQLPQALQRVITQVQSVDTCQPTRPPSSLSIWLECVYMFWMVWLDAVMCD